MGTKRGLRAAAGLWWRGRGVRGLRAVARAERWRKRGGIILWYPPGHEWAAFCRGAERRGLRPGWSPAVTAASAVFSTRAGARGES